MTKSTKAQRAEQANEVIAEIAARGRRFFHHKQSGRVAGFELTSSGLVRFRDEYTQKLIDVSREGRWNGFSGGGTLQSLVTDLGRYVSRGEPVDRRHFGPWAEWRCNGDVWGYGFEAMQDLRQAIAESACLAPKVPEPEPAVQEVTDNVAP